MNRTTEWIDELLEPDGSIKWMHGYGVPYVNYWSGHDEVVLDGTFSFKELEHIVEIMRRTRK